MASFILQKYSSFMASTLLLLGVLMASLELIIGVQSIGVCYGRLGNNLPPPSEVVDLYKSNNIASMRIYDPDQATLEALRGSNIELILGVPNSDLQGLATNVSVANEWVKTYVSDYSSDVRFKYIVVGNEVSPYNTDNARYVKYVLPAMQNIYDAIVLAKLENQIKVSTAIDAGVLGVSFPPSQGTFRSEVRSFLDPIVAFLVNSGAPFLAHVFPYFSYISDSKNVPLSYALFSNSASVTRDGQLEYRNQFDAIVDALYSALDKVGGSALEIVVSQSGWPSAGGTATSIHNARTYNQNLIQHVQGGTPKRPGKPIETYLFSMFNENNKSQGYERNWGLFYPNKQPVYSINFNWPATEFNFEFSFIC